MSKANELIAKYEVVLARPLKGRESGFLRWMVGWEPEMLETLDDLFAAFYKAGQDDMSATRDALEGTQS